MDDVFKELDDGKRPQSEREIKPKAEMSVTIMIQVMPKLFRMCDVIGEHRSGKYRCDCKNQSDTDHFGSRQLSGRLRLRSRY
jgi:hypothetical protein